MSEQEEGGFVCPKCSGPVRWDVDDVQCLKDGCYGTSPEYAVYLLGGRAVSTTLPVGFKVVEGMTETPRKKAARRLAEIAAELVMLSDSRGWLELFKKEKYDDSDSLHETEIEMQARFTNAVKEAREELRNAIAWLSGIDVIREAIEANKNAQGASK
jgi:hypothetical protein